MRLPVHSKFRLYLSLLGCVNDTPRRQNRTGCENHRKGQPYGPGWAPFILRSDLTRTSLGSRRLFGVARLDQFPRSSGIQLVSELGAWNLSECEDLGRGHI